MPYKFSDKKATFSKLKPVITPEDAFNTISLHAQFRKI